MEPLCVSLLSFPSPCFTISHLFLCGSFHQPSALAVCWEHHSFSRPRMTYNYLVFFSLSDFLCVAPGCIFLLFFFPLCSSELNKATSRCPPLLLSHLHPSRPRLSLQEIKLKSNSLFSWFFGFASLVGSVIFFLFFPLVSCRNPSCEVHQEPVSLNVIEPALHDTLPQCINTRCSQRYTSR